MFGLRFLRVSPAEYVLLYKKGRIVKQGAGLNFFYYAPTSSIVIVPEASRDAPFIFKETTADFQEIDIQGQVSYRVQEHEKLASILDFSVDSGGGYTGDGPEKLTVRLTNLVQVALREKMQSLELRDALGAAPSLVEFARERIKQSEVARSLGIEILDFSILKISPTPEIARALEAAARENLLKQADEAVYERRNFAVDQERRIQENELQTKISVEEKNRQIREEQMNAEIAVQQKKGEIDDIKMNKEIELEERKKELVRHKTANALEEARARAESLRLELEALTSLNPDLLEVLAANQMDSRKLVSRALRELAKNAEKIGNLNISPELMNSLLQGDFGGDSKPRGKR